MASMGPSGFLAISMKNWPGNRGDGPGGNVFGFRVFVLNRGSLTGAAGFVSSLIDFFSPADSHSCSRLLSVGHEGHEELRRTRRTAEKIGGNYGVTKRGSDV